jgi:ATP-dependent RNA helicase DDX31/DBP7
VNLPSGLPSNAPLADSSTFSGLGLDPLLSAHLNTKMKMTKPTAIQRSALHALLPGTSQQSSERDVFIQAQTGSGKTLSFLLPIIHDLLPLSSLSYIDRSIGTLAIIIAPTRELAKQISDVLEALMQLRLRPEDETTDGSTRLTRWLVSGLLSGGATRSHEKARLRKGIPILVSTPGRLLDHLQNTSSFNVGKCRWLVLDEADRLMDLGFEETITGIMQGLDGRRRLALQALEAGQSTEVGGWDWDRRRRTILCSATMREDVQKLAGTTLINPLMVKPTELDKPSVEPSPVHDGTAIIPTDPEKFTPPSQLSQNYVVVPLKLRLVALIALLRSLAQPQGRRGIKIVVFFSCTDSVDFHWHLLGGSTMDGNDEASSSESASDDGDALGSRLQSEEQVAAMCSLLPDTLLYRLHGSLPMPTRSASLQAFSATSPVKGHSSAVSSSILLCTSVASRGLDLPLVRAVIQYDLPTEGGATEYVHRVGRTARAGKGGEAWSFVAPSETEWVKWVESKMQGDQDDDLDLEKRKPNITLTGVGMENLLKSGFGGQRADYEERATEVQLSFERWVLRNKIVS